MDLIEKMYPNSGIPKLAGKVEKELHICMLFTCDLDIADGYRITIMDEISSVEHAIEGCWPFKLMYCHTHTLME